MNIIYQPFSPLPVCDDDHGRCTVKVDRESVRRNKGGAGATAGGPSNNQSGPGRASERCVCTGAWVP